MRLLFPIIPLALISLLSFGCLPKEEIDPDILPISGGIQLSLHTTGGTTGMNECIQISDHWQLSSVGRRHGWVRKLESDEQRELVKALQGFEFLVWEKESPPKESNGTSFTLTARGSGEGIATRKDAAELDQLVQKFINAKRIASR